MCKNVHFLCLVLSILNLVFIGSAFAGVQKYYALAPMAVKDLCGCARWCK